MYMAGAIIGVLFAIFLVFALSNVDYFHGDKNARLEELQSTDLSRSVGSMFVAISRTGVHIRDPERDMQLSWHTVVPRSTEAFVLLQCAANAVLIIPKRAFESKASAHSFLESAQAWWADAQQENTDKLVSYLSEQDAACPSCRYNLRGVRAAACPECGRALRLHELQSSL
jgi:hypothetical protein